MDKLHKAIAEQANIEEFNSYSSLVVNGNADNLDKIILAKHVLESMGYDTAMVYVYTTDEESKARNDERIARSAKTFTEEQRKEKYDNSIENMHSFLPLFEEFHIFDNSNDYTAVNESKKSEIIGWLEELGQSVSTFFETMPSSVAASEWIMESVSKKMKDFANKVPHQVKATGEQPKPVMKGYKRVKEGGFWKLVKEGTDGGAQQVGDSSSGDRGDGPMAAHSLKSGIRKNYMFGNGKDSKKQNSKGRKASTPPPSFFDSRMGAVPSGGVGLTVSHVERKGEVVQEKTFERLRKNLAALTDNVDKE